MIGILMATTLVAAADAPDLTWLAGYWLNCDRGREVSETWSQPTGTVQLGHNLTRGPGASAWEMLRIETLDGRLVYRAQPGGRPATDFNMIRSGAREVVFENRQNDFPQRIIYRRRGAVLTARIEGVSGGREESFEWAFQSAPLNSHCPRREGG